MLFPKNALTALQSVLKKLPQLRLTLKFVQPGKLALRIQGPRMLLSIDLLAARAPTLPGESQAHKDPQILKSNDFSNSSPGWLSTVGGGIPEQPAQTPPAPDPAPASARPLAAQLQSHENLQRPP